MAQEYIGAQELHLCFLRTKGVSFVKVFNECR